MLRRSFGTRVGTAILTVILTGALGCSRSPDPDRSTALREKLVDRLAAEGRVSDATVLSALREVPRHEFVPRASVDEAYADRALPIGHGQEVPQPTIVGMMASALKLDGSQTVLEIGTGCGYQTAVLSARSKQVYSLEIIAPLGEDARTRLAALGADNVTIEIGDGYRGWKAHAPFDRILLTAAPSKVPDTLIEQLASDGILVAPVGPPEGPQRLLRLLKREGRIEREDLGEVSFAPMVHEWKASSWSCAGQP